jgi:hypothetical protein
MKAIKLKITLQFRRYLMDSHYLLDYVPTWGIFLITVIIIFISFEGGFPWGRHRKQFSKNELKAPISSIVGAIADLDSLQSGFLKVRQQPMTGLLNKMNTQQ